MVNKDNFVCGDCYKERIGKVVKGSNCGQYFRVEKKILNAKGDSTDYSLYSRLINKIK